MTKERFWVIGGEYAAMDFKRLKDGAQRIFGPFEDQDEAYRYTVLLPEVPRLAVEAAASLGWDRWADHSLSIDRFGASAPGKIVLEELGYTGERVAVEARALVARKEGVS